MDTGTGTGAVLEWCRPLVEALPVPAVLLEPTVDRWVASQANQVFEDIVGADPSAVAEQVGKALERAPESAESLDDLRIHVDGPPDERGGRREWSLRVRPLRRGPQLWGALATFLSEHDGVGRVPVVAPPRELAALRDLATGMGLGDSSETIAARAVDSAVVTTGASRGALLLDDGLGGLAVLASTPDAGLPARLDRPPAWQQPAPRRAPASAVGAERLVPAGLAGVPGWERPLAAPLRLRRGQRGLLLVDDGGGGEAASERLRFVADLSATALDNAGLVAEFHRMEDLLRGAVEASAAMVEATEPGRARRDLLDRLVGDLGFDGAALWCPGNGDDRYALVEAEGLPDEVRTTVAHLPPGNLAAQTDAAGRAWPRHRLRLVSVPEPSEGVLGVYFRGPMPELVDRVLATLAHALAAAVHQTTLHQRARTVVDSLQRELRPRIGSLPPGPDVGYVYRSATSGVDVGGDFFDVFPAQSGHVGVACGDVSGKGVTAASLTAMAVYSLRAYAVRGASPQIVLNLLNAVVGEQTAGERFMTMAYGRLDVDRWAVDLALAGHPPPVLVGPDGLGFLDMPANLPIGIDPQASYLQTTLHLQPGDSLLLYTDGVTEARRGDAVRGELLGEDRLLRLVGGLAADRARAIADGLWAAVQDWTGGAIGDDCAILVLRRPPEPPQPR